MIRRALPMLTLAVAAACGGDPTVVRFEIPLDADLVTGTTLIQTLELSATDIPSGGRLEIRSEVRNTGSSPADVSVRICGLDVRGLPLALPPEVGMCGGYSMRTVLEPGESVGAVLPQVVEAAPGRYRLEVRHLVEPEHWAGVDIRVR